MRKRSPRHSVQASSNPSAINCSRQLIAKRNYRCGSAIDHQNQPLCAKMDSDSDSVALLAIKPRFAEAIITGRKKVEFRKTRFSQPPRYIVLYASTPVQQIVAYFEVAYIRELTPIGLWREFRKVGAIDYAEFSKYYGTRAIGYAIVVGAVWKLNKPTALRHVCPKSSVPQSFCYLQLNAISRLLKKARCSH